MIFRYKKDFLKAFDLLKIDDAKLVIEAEKKIRLYYIKNIAPFGLRIKKLYSKNNIKVYEGRISIKLRIIWIKTENIVSFAILGNHENIKNYLKRL